MKYNNALSAPHGFSFRDATAPVVGAFGTAAGKVGSLLARGVTQMQISRMQSVLNSMSDDQLERAGIKRNQIPQHAEALVTEEYDGL
ncbi:hypothetical protein DSM14862_00877 [Sulfitobacter indolifex]|uniref:DUF1127 domain-containing protein n=2 Tax=root TaxID=1 RepID=A0ABM9X6F1_9RHOB|nr:hypothetical protein [Sulfitobacter indolifex]EDQ05069.1 hypothetical protein OIHEL45_10018 [Sulfitobacter indolifex HEL-45]UOA18117.1 hypothetical protein DSM14862_00877 [Sulfitobacter indolifex]